MSPPNSKPRQSHSLPQSQPQPQSHHSQSGQLLQPQTDYETDQYYPSDVPGSQPPPLMQPFPSPPKGPPRSTSDLNLAVLKRHSPSIESLVTIAPYAVLYVFSAEKQEWVKCNVEGSLFICALQEQPKLPGAQRFVAIILNRRGLENFATFLQSPQDVEMTDPLIVLQVRGDGAAALDADGVEQDGGVKIYGLWIFSEKDTSTQETRTQIAQIIKDCAALAETSLAAAREAIKLSEDAEKAQQAPQPLASDAAEPAVAPMGRQLSLRELFGQQREQDAGFSVHQHHSPRMSNAYQRPAAVPEVISQLSPQLPPQSPPQAQQQPRQASMFVDHPDTAFFRGSSPYNAAMSSSKPPAAHNAGSGTGPPLSGNGPPDLLSQLFKKASQGQ